MTRTPCVVAYSARSRMSGRTIGSPPEMSSAGTLKAAKSSIIALASSVVSSPSNLRLRASA